MAGADDVVLDATLQSLDSVPRALGCQESLKWRRDRVRLHFRKSPLAAMWGMDPELSV